MKYLISFLIAIVALSFHVSAQTDTLHPRLFLRAGEEKALLRNISSDEIWTRIHNAIVAECDTICGLMPTERKVVGPRMHATSCEVLRRVLFLSYVYRMTGIEKYAARAEKEMLFICTYEDWHPSHFLDVAEMATALAIGYDWLYYWLPQSSRDCIEKNLVEKALIPGDDPKLNVRFTTGPSRTNNWGQVCNGGLAVAAIALATEQPELSRRTIARSSEMIKLPMYAEYSPSGCFPEGFGYWAFGTQYNILFIDSMQKYFGRESVREYIEVPGFIESGNYSQQLITPSLRTFGYSDNSTRIYLEPAVMWFNSIRKDPRMCYRQKALFDKFEPTRSYVKTIKNRLIPFMLIWGAGTGENPTVKLSEAEKPTENFYLGKGSNDICVMRTGWEPDDVYLGFKCGKVRNPHGHMDIGSFYLEAGGVRWSLDLGSDNYEDVQVAGFNLFSMSESSDRWRKLTKYNNFAHSTTYPEGCYQRIDAECPITGSGKEMKASSELAGLYPEQLKSILRTVSLKGRKVIVQDEVLAGEKAVDMVWNMTTEAVSFVRKGNKITLLSKSGKSLVMKVSSSGQPFSVEMIPATPKNKCEGQNKGISFLRICYRVPASTGNSFVVTMVPEK